mgnify:FL=1
MRCRYCRQDITDAWEAVKIVRANDRKETTDTMPGVYAHARCHDGNRADWRVREPRAAT